MSDLPTPECLPEQHEKEGGCYHCCNNCNYVQHRCHFCGTDLYHNSYGWDGKRHWLSDCRPDLVEHEPGKDCTWPHRRDPEFADRYSEEERAHNCYAYSEGYPHNVWTDEHTRFYEDGPMA